MSKSYLKFDVHRAKNGDVHGQYTGCVWRGTNQVEWLTSEFGRLATDTFPEAYALAQSHGIGHIDINNPELFATLGLGPTRQQGGDHAQT